MTSNIKSASIDEYGWRAVPVSLDKFLSDNHFDKSNAKPIPQDYQFKPLIPTGVLQENVFSFIKARLPEQTVNHSMRVFLYGLLALDQHFPHLFTEPHTKKLFVETYFLTCMLHDIGTADEFLKTTRMSFDFKGAIVAMEAMRSNLAPEEQCEAVGEAIIRHQDLGEVGSITTLGALIQLTTVFGKLSSCLPVGRISNVTCMDA